MITRNRILLTACAVLALTGLEASRGLAQVTNQITDVSPDQATQGTVSLLVTFTLDSDTPPPPPAGILPNSVTIGSMAGRSVTHASQYTVTALFDITDTPGAKDATIVFPHPQGVLTFSRAGGFTVIAAGNQPPTITGQPRSQIAPPGGIATFTATATGTEPLHYRWQKNEMNIDGAVAATYTISPVAWADSGDYRCVVTNDFGSATSDEAHLTVRELPAGGFPPVDTGQILCYDDTHQITCPQAGQAYYGQDSQIDGDPPSFTLSPDGLTVTDNVTGLIWQHSPDTNGDGSITATDKLTWTQAQARPAVLNAAHWGGYGDWRLPTIKELYSLIDFRGTDPSGGGDDTSDYIPFIDRTYFDFAYGQTSAGERIIDSQYASSNLYVGPIWGGEGGKLFGVNFADGRIKGYGLMINGTDKKFFVQCVRGNEGYGTNDFIDNGDGTITDRATGLMWSQDDSGSGMTWQAALAWAQTKSAATWLGHDDWRLPNVKELQTIVDYTRAPDALDPTHQGPACDPIFHCTQITNEACAADYPWYWSGTTHGSYTGSGAAGSYVCIGRSMGYMSGWTDVHGAGSQRSDPKGGSLSGYTHSGCGYYNANAPQGDAIRIYNYVRLVRDAVNPLDVGDDAGSGGARLGLRARPNPGIASAGIAFTLARAGTVTIRIYDATGRLVRTLAHVAGYGAGDHEIAWDGRDASGNFVTAGVYLVRMDAAGMTRTVKLTLAR